MVNYKYIVVPTEIADSVEWNTVVQDSIEGVRYNKNKTEFVLKFDNKLPTWYVDKPIYTKPKMMELLHSGDW